MVLTILKPRRFFIFEQGHILTINFLIHDVHMNVDQQDFNGDTGE